MDYSFGNGCIEVEKNFTKNTQVNAIAEAVAKKQKEKEGKSHA